VTAVEPTLPPTSSPPTAEPARPVWIVPATAAALAIALIALVALVINDGDDTASPPATTSTTVVPFALDPAAPEGSRAHPFPIGTSAVVAGWRITVQSVGGEGGALTANLLLFWDGRPDIGLGEPAKLLLRIEDGAGTLHRLGGSACPGDPAGDLAKVAPLDIGRSATVALCWTVTGVDRATAALVAADSAVDDTVFLAVA
jgi:hypothetical protein